MQADFSDEKRVREYLLGILPEEEHERIETRFLTDSDFENFVDLVEDEIIDDYMNGALTEGDRKAVEEHFLRPAERQQKLAFARQLRARLNSKPTPAAANPFLYSQPSRLPRVSSGTSAALVALLLVMTGSALYIMDLRRNLQVEAAKSRAEQAELERERARAARLEAQIKALPSSGQFMAVTLNAELRRGDPLPEVAPRAETRWIEAHIPLEHEPAPYRITLCTDEGMEILSMRGLKPTTEKDGSDLVFDIPAQLLPPGEYAVILNAGHGGRTPMTQTYKFKVLK